METPRQPDAFTQTLDTHPPSQSKLNAASKRTSVERELPHRAGTVNRLSKVLEQRERAKPTPPAKPSSLRITSPATSSRPPVPRSPFMIRESVPAIEIPSSIDETSMQFKDIRARFQSPNDKPSPQSIPLPSPRPLNTGSLPKKDLARHSPAGSLVTELSQRLEHQHLPCTDSPLLATPPPPPPHSSLSSTDPTSSQQYKSNRLSGNGFPIAPHPILARSGTGSSILSTASSSSTSSAIPASPPKRAWTGYSLTSWLSGNGSNEEASSSLKDNITIKHLTGEPVTSSTTPSIPMSSGTSYTESLPVSPQLSGSDSCRAPKRNKVVHELIETEKVYANDMALIEEIYLAPACSDDSPLSRADVRLIFSNLSAIVAFEKEFVPALSIACRGNDETGQAHADDDTTTVGAVFRHHMKDLQHIYSDYCKNHGDAMLRMQELSAMPDIQAFMEQCKENMQGRTASWDLGSLLIKPVQRVLKYPLLLREIFLLTPTAHADHEFLSMAIKEIQEVANHINELKRRKEIVEKIVGDKKKTDLNVVHGINKKISRKAQRFKQATGFAVEATQDTDFNSLHMQFEQQRAVVQQLASDVQQWIRLVKAQFDDLKTVVDSVEVLYGMYGGVPVRSKERVDNAKAAVTALAMTLPRELDAMVRAQVFSRIEDILRAYENPSQVISKRAQKLIDYDRVRDIKSKGEVPDKVLQESADTYVSINAQLLDELPKFFKLMTRYFEVLVGDIAFTQMRYYQHLNREWQALVYRHFPRVSLPYNQITADYDTQMQPVMSLINDITPFNQATWDALLGAYPSPRDESTGGNFQSGSLSMRSASFYTRDDYFDRTSAPLPEEPW